MYLLMYVFPAHAGMSRHKGKPEPPERGFPRSRGDEPKAEILRLLFQLFSPLTRG